MGFRIGQKVVCVAKYTSGAAPETSLPRLGSIYTVREIVNIICPAIRLMEIKNPPVNTTHGNMEQSFNAETFRPVTEKQTDISVFTEILDRENKNCRVPVGRVTACEVNINFHHLLKRVSDHQS